MRITRTIAWVIALAFAALGVLVASGSSAAGDDGGGVEVIDALRTTVSQNEIDTDRSGTPTLGDQFVFTADFTVNGKKIGYDGGSCTLVRMPATYQCSATNVFANGQVTAQGLLDFTQGHGPYHVAVTGGTGAYKTVRGQVKLTTDTPKAGQDLVRFTLIK